MLLISELIKCIFIHQKQFLRASVYELATGFICAHAADLRMQLEERIHFHVFDV